MSSNTPAEHTPNDASELSDSQKPTNVRWSIFALSCGTSWFLYLHRYTWMIISPEIQVEYGLNDIQMGSLVTCFSVPYGIGQIPSGILSDLVGPHIFLGSIIILWSLALCGHAIANGFYSFAAMRVLFGAAQSGAYPNLTNVTATWFPVKIRTFVQGAVASFFGRGGAFLSPLIMGVVLMKWMDFSWQDSVLTLGATGVLFGVLFLWLFRNSPKIDKRVNDAEEQLIQEGERKSNSDAPKVLPWKNVFQQRSMRFFIVQQIMSAGADGFYLAFLGIYLRNVMGFDLAKTGILASLPLLGGALGGLFGGYLNELLIRTTGDRRKARVIVGFTGKIIAAVFMLGITSLEKGEHVAYALVVVKFFTDWSQPTVWGTCTDMGGRYSATVFSIINTAGSIGGIICPMLFGVILHLNTTNMLIEGVETKIVDYNPVFLTVVGMYVISAFCWFGINCNDSLETEIEQASENS